MNKKLFILVTILLLIIPDQLFSQQGNNWYFGMQAGITFNTNPPSALYNSALSTKEGCSTISDTNGQLLFYTDGRFVYNKNHQVMPNGSGLMGHPSSSNSAIIVKQPGSDSLYFIFTVDAAENQFSNGYRYSIVDMSLNAGLGDVNTKNVLMYAKCSEKITAVKHINGTDVWIVTKDFQGNTYKVYKLGCSGLNMSPVISNIGIPYGTSIPLVGSIKASPDGSKIATVQFTKGWEIFDFDGATGKLYNPMFIELPNSCVFGLEFSPDSKLLYLASECNTIGNTTTGGGVLRQYKIDVYDSLTISNSEYIVATSGSGFGDMQLGPDDKIYIPNEQDTSLNEIEDPNSYGASCSFLNKAINLGEGRFAMRCLPAFFKDNITNLLLDFSFTASPDCSSITFTGSTSLPQPVTYNWDFGDGNMANGQTVTHTFSTNGNFLVKLSVNNSSICGANGIRTKAINNSSPVARIGFQLDCGSKMIQFKDSSTISYGGINSWQWDFGDGQTSSIKNPLHDYATYGQYLVKLKVVSSGICSKEDSVAVWINVFPKSPATIYLGNDTTICNDKLYILNAKSGFKNYVWQNGSTDSIITVTQPGMYFVTANDYCGNQYSDTINIKINQPASINLGNDTSICANQPFILDAGNGFKNYVWNTGNTAQLQPVSTTGNYSVTATDSNGCATRDTIAIINIYPAPLVQLNKNPVLCLTQNNRLSPGNDFATYLWQDGSTDSVMTVTATGLYKVIASNKYHCFSSDSVLITKLVTPPVAFLNKDTIICRDETITLVPQYPFNQYLWSTGATSPSITVMPPADVWLKVMDENNCMGADSIQIIAKDCPTYIYFPNAFTPNSDGVNDLFKPAVSGRIEQYQFAIYNRYGQKVFAAADPLQGWDGRINGAPQNGGVFVWICSYKFLNALPVTKKGTVMLIR